MMASSALHHRADHACTKGRSAGLFLAPVSEVLEEGFGAADFFFVLSRSCTIPYTTRSGEMSV